jgi:hypothetical protein
MLQRRSTVDHARLPVSENLGSAIGLGHEVGVIGFETSSTLAGFWQLGN